MSITQSHQYPIGVELIGDLSPGYAEIVTPDAIAFVTTLVRRFSETRENLLKKREERQRQLDAGALPDFLQESEPIRNSNWAIAPLPVELHDRRVEITGPAGDRKMVINALNSGAKVFMADFEDANSPTWENTIQGQINLRDAIRGTISFENPGGKQYQLNKQTAVLFVRPRGWHLEEKHLFVDGRPVSASLFDFGLYLYHNATALKERGSAPYFYLPKIESHLEARLWNEVFVFAQNQLGIAQGTIKATVLIETILATFEMDEILYELREHSAGLNCGRWDYIFSYMKKLRNHRQVILPDRSSVTMTVPFMRAYTLLTIKTCHKRNAPAIGGMAAQIPVKHDAAANEEAMNKVRADKEREAQDGHDGTWVAHPGLVPIAMEVFDRFMPEPNQIGRKREDVQVTAADLLAVPEGQITEAGLRTNISVAIRYVEAWLRGSGAVPIFHLMEDAATAEISRAQVWQWIRHPRGVLQDGRKITLEMVQQMIEEEATKAKQETNGGESETEHKEQNTHYALASQLFEQLVTEEQFVEFLTIPGYKFLQ